jgi:membrane protein implicated in regulation of membrane protease activity
LAQSKKINWLHLSTLIAVAILVGTEMVGASWAAGWALGGLLQLDPLINHALEGVFALCGVVLLFYFMRTALRNEPIRE